MIIELKKGYYLVKFYNNKRKMILFYNGMGFEGFASDEMIHDEIESYFKLDIRKIKEN